MKIGTARILPALLCGTLLSPVPHVRADDSPPPLSTIRAQSFDGVVKACDGSNSADGLPSAEFLPYFSVSPLYVAPTSGTFADFTRHAWAARAAYTHPWLVAELDHGALQLALQGNVQETVLGAKRDVFGLDPAAGLVSVDSVQTTLFGIGPSLTYFPPPSDEGRQVFLGLSAVGNGGWGQVRFREAPVGAVFGHVIPIQGAGNNVDTRAIWGTTLSGSTGVVFRNGVALSLSAGWALWRTDLIQGTDRNSDLVFGALNVQIPTEALCQPFQSWRCP